MVWFLTYLLAGLAISWSAMMGGKRSTSGWLIEIIAILTWPLMIVFGFVAAWRQVRERR